MIISGTSNLGGSADVGGCDVIPPSWQVAHYLLTGTAEDSLDNFDGSETSATYIYDSERGVVYDGGGSVSIPNTSGLSCTYWLDSGAGWVFTYSTTIPSTLSTNKYSNLVCYNKVLSTGEQSFVEGIQENIHNTPIDNGLVAYYPLAGNSLDNAISGADGTDNGVSYVYDAEMDKVVSVYSAVITSRSSLNAKPIDNTDTYSISGWVKLDTAGYFGIYTSNLDGWYGHGIEFIGDTTNITFSHVRSDEVSGNNEIDTPQRADGAWHHYVAVRSGTAISLYEDGILVDSGNLIHNTTTNHDNAYIGAYENNNSNTPQVENSLSNVRCYTRALSQAEIDAIYEYEKPNSTVCLTDEIVQDYGLVVHYPLENDFNDYTINGEAHDGVNNGVTFVNESAHTVVNGVRQYVSLYGLANKEFVGTSITMSAWIKVDAFGSAGGNYVNLMSGTTGYTTNSGSSQFNINISNTVSNIVCSFKSPQNTGYGSYNSASIHKASPIVLGTLYYVTTVYDKENGKLQLYFDGVLDGELVVATEGLITGTFNDASNYIGEHENANWETDAYYSDVKIHNRALDSTEILEAYNNEKSKFGL